MPTELVVPYIRILLPSLFWEVIQNYFFRSLESSYHLQFPVALDSAPLSHRTTLNPAHTLCSLHQHTLGFGLIEHNQGISASDTPFPGQESDPSLLCPTAAGGTKAF